MRDILRLQVLGHVFSQVSLWYDLPSNAEFRFLLESSPKYHSILVVCRTLDKDDMTLGEHPGRNLDTSLNCENDVVERKRHLDRTSSDDHF